MNKQEILNQYIKNYKEIYRGYPILEQTIEGCYIKTVLRQPEGSMNSNGFVVVSNGFAVIEDPKLINEYSIDSSINAFKNFDLSLLPDQGK
ncbi:MAG: hypothetical protein ACRC54_04630 [Fusobacteriaceae bacterium]